MTRPAERRLAFAARGVLVGRGCTRTKVWARWGSAVAPEAERRPRECRLQLTAILPCCRPKPSSRRDTSRSSTNGDAARRRARSGPRSGLHGAAACALLVAAHQPQKPARVQARQRAVHTVTSIPLGDMALDLPGGHGERVTWPHVSQTVVWDTFERHHGPERSDSPGENLLALLAQLGGKFRPRHPSRTARGRKLGGCSGQVARRVES